MVRLLAVCVPLLSQGFPAGEFTLHYWRYHSVLLKCCRRSRNFKLSPSSGKIEKNFQTSNMFFHLKPVHLMTFYLKQLLWIQGHDSMAIFISSLILGTCFSRIVSLQEVFSESQQLTTHRSSLWHQSFIIPDLT